jgi:biopolymer transport protein ExbB/TolQ
MDNGTGVAAVHLLHWFATVAPTASTPDVWGWLSGTLSVSDVISGSGLAFIVFLFAARKILTIADHRARVADLEKYYDALLKEKDTSASALATAKDARYDEMLESRNYWREAHNEQRTRAEKAEDGVREFADEYAKLSNHLLGSIEQAAEVTP